MMQSAVRSEAGCGRAAASSTPEADLIKRAQAFDEGAISFIFDNYYPRVYNYGLIQVRDVQAAEDLASDVMLRVLEAIPRYRARGVPLSAWIFRIARNRLVDIRRNRTRRREVGLEDSQIAAPGSPHASVERALNYGQVCTALEKLTEVQAQVIVLRFLRDFDVATVARILGRSESAIKSLQFRALASLRRILQAGAPSAVPGASHRSMRRLAGYAGLVAAPAGATDSPSSR